MAICSRVSVPICGCGGTDRARHSPPGDLQVPSVTFLRLKRLEQPLSIREPIRWEKLIRENYAPANRPHPEKRSAFAQDDDGSEGCACGSGRRDGRNSRVSCREQ